MLPKTTSDLRREMFSQPDLAAYLDQNRSSFSHSTVKDLLEAVHARRPVSKTVLARRANMSEVYVYQVFSGRRHPSRDRLLCLCIALRTSLDETQDILRRASYGELYPRLERDAIIAHGIAHGTALEQINDSLLARGEQPLC